MTLNCDDTKCFGDSESHKHQKQTIYISYSFRLFEGLFKSVQETAYLLFIIDRQVNLSGIHNLNEPSEIPVMIIGEKGDRQIDRKLSDLNAQSTVIYQRGAGIAQWLERRTRD